MFLPGPGDTCRAARGARLYVGRREERVLTRVGFTYYCFWKCLASHFSNLSVCLGRIGASASLRGCFFARSGDNFTVHEGDRSGLYGTRLFHVIASADERWGHKKHTGKRRIFNKL